jgi:membrane protease YdiL (CAAX protease family)
MLRRTWIFFAITFGIAWLLWLPGVLRSNGFETLPAIAGLPGMFAVFAPAIAAFILVGHESGRAGTGKLLRRAFAVGFSKLWWLPTFLLLPAIGFLTIAILLLMGRELPDWTAPTLLTALSTATIILFIGGGLEEFGWRGYALDRIQNGQNAVIASLVLGLFWGVWHLPLFFIDGTVQHDAGIPVWEFVYKQWRCLYYTWLYNNTIGSLLVAILFHTIGNTTSALLPIYFGTEIGRWVNFVLLLITAGIVALIWGWRTLNRDRPVPQPSLPDDG